MDGNADKLRQELLAGAEEFLNSARPMYQHKAKYRKSIFELLNSQVQTLAAKNGLDTSAETWYGPLKVILFFIFLYLDLISCIDLISLSVTFFFSLQCYLFEIIPKAYFDQEELKTYQAHWVHQTHYRKPCGRNGSLCRRLRRKVLEETREVLVKMYPDRFGVGQPNRSFMGLDVKTGEYSYYPEEEMEQDIDADAGTSSDFGAGGSRPATGAGTGTKAAAGSGSTCSGVVEKDTVNGVEKDTVNGWFCQSFRTH